jgi:signal transduction histidine kinase
LDGSQAIPAELRAIELFAGLTGEQLEWLSKVGNRRKLADGTVLFEDGEEGNYFYVILTGGLLITKSINGKEQVMSRHFVNSSEDAWPGQNGKPLAASQFTGELPMLAGGAYVARGAAVGETEVIAYNKTEFFNILARCPHVCRVLLPVLAWRIRSYERQSGRSALLEALGTLAAGLAHELNNPAAAAARAAHGLADAISALTESAVDWGARSSSAEQDALGRLSLRRPPSDPIEAAEVSEETARLLASRGVSRPERLALLLADQGINPEDLRLLDVREEVFGSAVRFQARSAQARVLAEEIAEGLRRIETLIGSVKDYSSVGRAPLGDVILADGVDATLAMMTPKLHGIRIQRSYADIPPIPGYPGELNQVWTNLIENAADAMRGTGELRVRIYQEGNSAVVEFGDNGPGIPADTIPRLFQPFFTTKEIGKGTGLGLHLSRDIVVQRHKGHIDVTSLPGDTRFSVHLPLFVPAGLGFGHVPVDEGRGHGTLAHSGSQPLHGAGPDIACGEDPRHAGLEKERRPRQVPAGDALGGPEIGAGEDESVVVPGYGVGKPLGPRPGTDKRE